MPYAPKKRRRIRWKVLIPVLVLIMLIIYLIVGLFLPDEEEVSNDFTVCGLTPEETLEKLNQNFTEVFTVRDYLFYGESLGLYETSYSPENEDSLAGKTVELHNVCDDTTISMIMDNTIDNKILLDELDPGFYDVSILDKQVKKRIVFSEAFRDDTFTTIVRDGHIHRITLIADKELLKNQGIVWNENYLFIQVEEEEAKTGDIDVLIDPYGMNTDLTYLPDEGNSANGLHEYEEVYEAALIMKEELESYGLRVEVSKNSADEEGRAYGEDGHLITGYQKNARYYLYLRFNAYESDGSVSGMEIQYSAHASSNLARTITYYMEKNISMPLCTLYSGTEIPGVVSSYLIEGADGKVLYDVNLNIRESGGRATLAGRYSEIAQEENAYFQDKNGMLGLEIDFINVANKQDAALWKKNKETIVKECAKAFALGINVIDDE